MTEKNTENLWSAYEAAAATGGALCARGGDPKRPRRVLAAAGLIGDVERGGIAVEVDPTGSFDGRGAFNDTSVMVAGGAGAALPEVSDDDDDESP